MNLRDDTSETFVGLILALARDLSLHNGSKTIKVKESM